MNENQKTPLPSELAAIEDADSHLAVVSESPLGALLAEVAPGERALLAFFESEGIGAAIQQTGFTREELVHTIVGHIRDKDPKVSQKAIDQFRAYITQAATVNGRIGRITASQTTENSDGSQTTHKAATLSLVRPSSGHSIPGARVTLPRADIQDGDDSGNDPPAPRSLGDASPPTG